MKNITKVNLNTRTNIDWEDYHKFIYSSDYNTFEEFITSIKEKTLLCEEETLGVVVAVVEDWDYIERLPTLHEKFFVEGKEVCREDFENYDGEDYYYKSWWTHTEDITLGIEDFYSYYRMIVYFMEKDSFERETFEKSWHFCVQDWA